MVSIVVTRVPSAGCSSTLTLRGFGATTTGATSFLSTILMLTTATASRTPGLVPLSDTTNVIMMLSPVTSRSNSLIILTVARLADVLDISKWFEMPSTLPSENTRSELTPISASLASSSIKLSTNEFSETLTSNLSVAKTGLLSLKSRIETSTVAVPARPPSSTTVTPKV